MAKSHLSLRMESKTRERLAERARSERTSQGALVNRYVEEGLRRDRHPRITFVARISGRVPSLLARPRLLVAHIVETWRASRKDPTATARYFGMAEEEVLAALAYYAEFRTEVDDWIAWNRTEADRLEREWRSEQKLHG
ncbi:MAG: hypothetical protein HYY42_01225 [Chloroflexi bacterium]|nr:hypothetical protein [Chloroflexota bacterium]